MRRVFMLLILMMTLTASASAEWEKFYTYGGSGFDYLWDMDVSEDGRILMTGHTESADGTLSERTKTGRTGWALCVDADGNVLWSFCSRNGEEAWMDCPVFHEDGSATVLLYSGMGAGGVEMIRLSAQGEDIWRKEIIPEGMGSAFYADATPLGYIFSGMNEKDVPCKTMLFNWEGEKIRTYDDLFEYFDGSMRGRFLLGGTYEVKKILRMNDAGEYETFAELEQKDWALTTSAELREMKDGGVLMFMGLEPGSGASSRVLRFSAQGELMYDMNIVDGEISDVRDGGGVVLLRGAASGWDGAQVTRLGDDGVITGSDFISEDDGYFTYGCLGVLPDGRAAVLGQSTEPGKEADPMLAITQW